VAHSSVKGQQLHASAVRRCEQVGVCHLAVTDDASTAHAQHLVEAEVQRHQAVRRVRHVESQHFGNFCNSQCPARERGLADDAHKCRLRERTCCPTLPGMAREPTEHALMVFMRWPA